MVSQTHPLSLTPNQSFTTGSSSVSPQQNFTKMETSTISSIPYFANNFNTKTITNPISHVSFPHSHFAKPKNQKTKRPTTLVVLTKSSSSEETNVVTEDDEWVKNLPDKKKPLYSHSLPCVEGWLKGLGFVQSHDDRAVWVIEKVDWHAKLSLDVTDLYIRYLKSGPGNLDKDVERRFSYALSREDIENAILGGP